MIQIPGRQKYGWQCLAVPAKVKEQAVGVAWMLLTYTAIIVNELVNVYSSINHSNLQLGRTEMSTYM